MDYYLLQSVGSASLHVDSRSLYVLEEIHNLRISIVALHVPPPDFAFGAFLGYDRFSRTVALVDRIAPDADVSLVLDFVAERSVPLIPPFPLGSPHVRHV